MATYEIRKSGSKFQVFEGDDLFVWTRFTKKAAAAYISRLHELEAEEVAYKAYQKTFQRGRVAAYLATRAARPTPPIQTSLF